MNKSQPKKSGHQHNHQHQSQDNCDGCQQQRRENNMLVDFYERLNKIENKVDRIKDNVSTQQNRGLDYKYRIKEMNRILMNKPEQTLRRIKEHDSKEMGYELASALIEREIKTKMENQRLQSIIQQLQKDKLKLEQQKKHSTIQQNYRLNRSLNLEREQKQLIRGGNNTQSRYSDVIDEVRKTNDSSYFLQRKKVKNMSNSYFQEDGNKKFWQEGSLGQDQTNFSNFTAAVTKQKSKSEDKHQYEGLNLWLYQFKPEELQQTPIKSLKKPANQKKMIVAQAKNKANF